MRAHGLRVEWLALPLLAFLALVYFWPVGALLSTSITEPRWGMQNYAPLWDMSVYLHVFLRTFVLAIVVTGATLLIAYPMAYQLTVAASRTRHVLIFCLLVPSWTSVLVRTFGWQVLLGRRGVVNRVLLDTGIVHHPLQLMFNSTTVAFAMVQILMLFMVLPIFNTLRTIDAALVPAAIGLGASRLQAFVRIYLPLSLPGIVAGSSIVFVLSLGFFITPALIGGTHDITVAMLIMQQFMALLNWGFGAALATVLLVLALAVLRVFGWAARDRRGAR